MGYIRMARAVFPIMKAQGGGRIVNVTGAAARNPTATYLTGGAANAALVNFTKGNSIINAGKAYGEMLLLQNNERKTALNRWTPTNTNTDIPRANQNRPRRLYSTLVEDGSYIRLQSVTLGFQIPPGIIPRVTSAHLYITGQNLLVATRYSGFDPDVNSMGGDARFGGIDIGAYPRSRVWNFGINATF